MSNMLIKKYTAYYFSILAIATTAIITITLSGCGTIQNYQTAVHSWNGAPVSALTARWGYPNEIEKQMNGNSIYIYQTYSRGTYAPTAIPGVTPVQPFNNNTLMTSPSGIEAGSHSIECTTQFEINAHGYIMNSNFDGTDCSATTSSANRKTYAK